MRTGKQKKKKKKGKKRKSLENFISSSSSSISYIFVLPLLLLLLLLLSPSLSLSLDSAPSSVNPIIYAYSSREFRRAFIKYLCRCFPMRIRNLMMSYHNLHLLRYRRAPESNLSKENNESGSDHNHHINHHHHHHHHPPSNLNKQHMLPSSSSTPTIILTNIQNRTGGTPYKHSSLRRQTKDKRQHSRMNVFSHCCRTNSLEQENKHDQRSSSSTSSKNVAISNNNNNNNVLVDYCTYHDVAVSRVTCV